MPDTDWYYLDDAGNTSGPQPTERMRAFTDSGLLRADSLVWAEHLSEWTRVDALSVDVGAQAVAHTSLAALASAENLKTVYVATLPELVEAMEEPEVGRIFLNDSIALAGSPLPTIDGRLLEIEAGPACAAPCALSGAGGRIFNVGGRPGGLSLSLIHI